MKHLYYLLLLCGGLAQLPLQAQNWRPFRPNRDVHAFHGTSADTVLTMRLDSAARQGADSVYYFNHTVRRVNNPLYLWEKSANNQFGQLLRYNPAQRTYSLFWNGGPSTAFIQDKVMVLKPFARVGETWSSYFTDYGVQTTLLSRGTSLIDGVTDSIATFRFSTGVTVVLSKNHGLVSAPKDLQFGVPTTKMLTLARRPAPAGLSYYNPLTLLDLQPGNELGYHQLPPMSQTITCYNGYLLRRVLSRQLTADSLIYTFQQQSRITYVNAPSCSGSGVYTSPVGVVRMAASRKTGQWAGQGIYGTLMLPAGADLLAYEYRVQPGSSSRPPVMMGNPVVPARPGAACGGPALLKQQMLYPSGGGTGYAYVPGIDALGWEQLVGTGVGTVMAYEHSLVYFLRTANGVDQTCGSRTNFGLLLPTKAAQRLAAFELYPNPAAESATLRLAGAARAATTVRLLDNLGRAVRTERLATGQTELTLALQNLAPGLYLLEVQTGREAAQYRKLQHTR